jgi:hypothetical protein
LKAANGAVEDEAGRLTSLERKLDELCNAVDDIREQMSVSGGSNGTKQKTRSK